MSKGSKRRPLGVDAKTFSDNWDRIFGKKEQLEVSTNNCGKCFNCVREQEEAEGRAGDALNPNLCRYFVCEYCGNKRCPHATDHKNECTNSNEPGQPGSSYE